MNSTRDQIDVESRKEPERLEREIDQQRDTIGNIVSALENKLSPGEIVDRVMRAGKGTGGAIEKGGVAGAMVLGTIGYGLGALAKNVVHVARENPVPTLLASTGLVWLYASRQDSSPVRQSGATYGSTYATRAGGNASMYANGAEDYGSGEGIKDKAAHLRDKVKDGASDLRDGVSERASHLKEGISERASHLREGASHKLGNAKDHISQTAHNAADTVRHQADRAREGYSHLMEQNPLVVGAIALGIGALLGAALPTTRKEDELLGQTGDKLRSKAGEATQAVREKGREVAQSVRESGSQTLKDLGEASGSSASGGQQPTQGYAAGASESGNLGSSTSQNVGGAPRTSI